MRYTLKHYLGFKGTPLLLSVPLGLLAVAATRYALLLNYFYAEFLSRQSPVLKNTFMVEGIPSLVTTLSVACAMGALVWLSGLVIGLIRKSGALSVVRGCYIALYLLALLYTFAVFRMTGLIFGKELKVSGIEPTAVNVFFWRYDLLWPIVLLALVVAGLHVLSWRRQVMDLYTGYHEATLAPGDRIIENIRTHGADPRFRKSIIYSILIHFTVIVLIPYLAQFGGCVEKYGIPEGEGGPVISIVKVVKPKKKPKKRILLNPRSAISFHIPTPEDSELEKEVEEMTQLTYVTDPSAVHRPGVTGKRGGWPGGMKDAVVRFIRMEYDGENWDDGMDAVSRADINFLEEFKKATGFKTAGRGESNPVRLLDDYPKGFAPPFVYMTGSGRINIPPRDIEILRKYLMDGGMLFADCGSGQWDRSFRAFLQVLFPGEPLLVIADDDPIYQMPFVFENGAPPLWHHGGMRALGIRRGRRWVVYYHPGDMNDAWKTGHSGMRPELTKRAYQLGINIAYHAFTHYLEATRKYRK